MIGRALRGAGGGALIDYVVARYPVLAPFPQVRPFVATAQVRSPWRVPSGTMLERHGRDLLPAPTRLPVVAVVTLAAVAFAALAVHVSGSSGPAGLDLGVDRIVARHTTFGTSWAEWATLVGAPATVVVVACVLAAAALLRRRYRLAVLAVVGPGLTGVATTALKPVVGRTIGGEGFAFPSGHTGGATAIGLVVAITLLATARPGRAAALTTVACCAVVLGGTAAVGMVVERAHYPTDTVGGFAVAVVLVLGTALVLDVRPRSRAG